MVRNHIKFCLRKWMCKCRLQNGFVLLVLNVSIVVGSNRTAFHTYGAPIFTCLHYVLVAGIHSYFIIDHLHTANFLVLIQDHSWHAWPIPWQKIPWAPSQYPKRRLSDIETGPWFLVSPAHRKPWYTSTLYDVRDLGPYCFFATH